MFCFIHDSTSHTYTLCFALYMMIPHKHTLDVLFYTWWYHTNTHLMFCFIHDVTSQRHTWCFVLYMMIPHKHTLDVLFHTWWYLTNTHLMFCFIHDDTFHTHLIFCFIHDKTLHSQSWCFVQYMVIPCIHSMFCLYMTGRHLEGNIAN